MNFAKDSQYKLVEAPHGLALLAQGDNLLQKEAQPLMVGTAGQVITYLDRYLYEREKGTEMRLAHELALGSSGITTVHPQFDIVDIGKPT